MKGIFTLMILAFLCLPMTVFSQNCDPLSPPDVPAAGCACAFPDCSFGLNGFSATLGTLNTAQTFPGCANNILNNDDWIAFIAGSTSINITLNISNCQGSGNNGGTGVQAAFYSGCSDPINGTDEGIASGPLDTQCGCTTNNITLDYNNFVVGQTYYIVIDGCGGDICDYLITVNSGSTQVPPPGDPTGITGPTVVCPGATATYTVTPVDGIPDWNWIVNGGTIVDESANTVTITWNSSGSIMVSGENACYSTNSVDLNVSVQPLAPIDETGEYCDDDPQGYYFPVDGNYYTAGFHPINVIVNEGGPNDGCTQPYNLTVTANPTYDITVDRVICFGDQVIYGGQAFDQPGPYQINLQTQNTMCDSIINLNLTVLDPLSFVNLQPPLDVLTCTQTSVLVDGSQSFPAQDIQFYNWTSPTNGDICGGLGTPVITVCTPGTYCLEVGYGEIDGESGQLVTCTNESCIDVTENVDAPLLSIDFTNVSCGGADDGTATVTINGGQDPFLIAWNDQNNTVTETVTDLPAGTYTVSVFSLGNGCTASETVTILEPDPILLDISSTSTICAGEASGSATVVASGGAGSFMYQWDDPSNQTGATATGLGTGTYTVVVTDANGCTMENTIMVDDAAPMSVTIDGVDILCNGDNSGSATATGSGGTGVYTYAWDDVNGQVTQTAVDLPAGDYNVIITDENGCTATNSVSLVEADELELTTSSTQASCGGNADGSATVSPTGGTAPYSYQWNDPDMQVTATASDIPAGNYIVVVTDANGCTAETNVDVDQPSGVTITTDFVDTQCNGSLDGEASVDAMGGTPPLTYQWDDPNNQTGATATGLGAGTYTVIVTDANDCSITETIIVGEPTAIELTESGVDALCDGSIDGEVSVSATGGTPPYEYAWDDPNTQNTATATGLGAGTYTVIVTDANDCTETVSVTIIDPSAIQLTEDGVDALCNGSLDGEVSVSATGGTAPYSYSWDDPNAQITATATGLGAGTYTVIVTDANDCTETVNVTILEPTELEVTANGTNPDCFNSGDGTASVSAIGGTAPYSYSWDDPNGQNTATASGLDAGTFTVIVTDANGCSMTESIDLTAPPAINLDTDQVDILCTTESTGEATVIATGGTPPLSYEWDDNANQNTATATGLEAGTYNVIVTDNNGCSETISVTLTEPAEVLSASGTSTDALCGQNDGTIDVTVTGGTAPYSFDWNGSAPNIEDPTNLGPGSYSVVITDANGCTTTTTVVVASPDSPSASVSITDVNCNGEQNGAMDVTVAGGISPYTYVWDTPNNGDQDLLNVGAGSYSVTVTDQAGCTTVANGVIPEPDLLEATATASPADCGIDNGSISVVVSGGVGVYDFDWPGTGQDGTQSPTGLAPGSYEVTITDENGCTVTATADVVVPNGPSTSLVSTDAGCNGDSTGTVSLTITGGTGPYDIDWGDPNLNGNENLNSLPAGTYDVIVTDANNCSATGTIDVLEPELLEATVVTTPLNCNGSNDGTATVSPTGGTAPYTYTWCDGQSTQTATNYPAGDCIVVVTDANGCTVELTATVDEPTALVADAVPFDADCNAAATGSIDVTVSGGTGGYTYTWTGGIPDTQDPVDIAAGSYDVVITDANGCTIEITAIQVNEPDAISISSITTDATCNQSNGTIDLTVTGGTTPYTYAWTGGLPPDEDPQSAATGSYDVVVTDANGCTATHTTIVDTPAALGISAAPVSALCNGSSTGIIDVTVTGGTPPFTYQWDDPASQTTEDAVDLPAGDYTLIVTDDNGCTITVNALVDEPTAIQSSNTTTDALCGESNGTIDLTVTGGTPPYSYLWSNGSMDEDPTALLAGSYNVTITDDNGCELEQTVIVSTPNQLEASAETFDALCFGSSTGSIDMTITGGTAPYDVIWGGIGVGEDQTDVPAGDYVGIVTDADGCQVVVAASIDEPEELILNGTSEQATCNQANGSIDLTVTGGTAPFSFDWSNGDMTEDPQGVAAGSYDVIVTDANGCTATYTQAVSTPSALGTSTQSEDALCNGSEDGEIDLTVTGGTAPYTYAWSNASLTEDVTGIGAGTYTVTVTDSDGCTITATASIGEPPILEVFDTSPSNAVSCNGGNDGGVALTVEGGTPGYTYDWSDDTYDGILSPNTFQAGDYTLTVTDANGCTATYEVTITEPAALSLGATSEATFCNGSSDGEIDLTVSGGTSPYTYDWNNGTYQDQDPQNVTAGNYTVIVTDANGCTETTSVFVDQPAAILVNIGNVSNYGGVNVSCANALDGSAEASANGGTAPYTFEWNTGVTTPMIDNIGPGLYQVTVTDINGCTSESQVSLSSPPSLDITADVTDPTCFEENDGVILVEGIGGTAPYLYSLDGETFSGLNIFGGLTAGSYTITVQDVNGCEELIDASIVDPQELLVDLGDDIVIQMGDSVQLDPIANIPQFALDTFTWARTEITDYNPWVAPLQTQTYYITVVNESGCIAEDEIVVRVRKDRLIYIPNAFTPNDDGFNDLFIIHGGQGVKEIKTFRIFNRWGEIIYEGLNFQPNDPDFGWNGKFKEERLNPAVFVYLVEVEFIDGRVEIYKGDVSLVR